MADQREKAIFKEFQQIPGVSKLLSQDLYDLGYRLVDELKGQNPEEMYEKHCMQQGQPVDRCVLYVFREAVYYASNDVHDPELLKCWNWKDKK